MSAHSGQSEHIDSAGTYILVFVGLIVLTLLTTAVAFVDLGFFSVVTWLSFTYTFPRSMSTIAVLERLST